MGTAALIVISLILMVSLIYNVVDYRTIKSCADKVRGLKKGKQEYELFSKSQVRYEFNILFPGLGDYFFIYCVFDNTVMYRSLSEALITGFEWPEYEAEYLTDIYLFLIDIEQEELV